MSYLNQDAIRRIVIALLAEELGTQRGKRLDAALTRDWSEETRLDEDGLDLDSLEIVACATRLNEFFHMHEVGAEDYLLARRSIGEWCELAAYCLERFQETLTFRTSGTTGTPKPCPQPVAPLKQEIDFFADLYGDRHRIVSLVPAHHIYGFLFTALLPSHLGIPVVDARMSAPGGLFDLMRDGDLAVGMPDVWRFHCSAPPIPPASRDWVALSSTAPSYAGMEAGVLQGGARALHEIYGSSETGGIAWRDSAEAPFTLLPHWQRVAPSGDGETQLRRTGPDGSLLFDGLPPDHLQWEDDNRFWPAGRRDGAIQIGGINIFPERIAQALENLPWVLRARILTEDRASGPALSAVITPGPNAPGPDACEAELRRFCRDRLSAPERPKSFRLEDAA